MPSISISVSNDIYQLLIEYRNENNLSQSAAGSELIKMGFAWDAQQKDFIKEQKKFEQERKESEAVKTVTVKAMTKAVKQAQKPRIKVKL